MPFVRKDKNTTDDINRRSRRTQTKDETSDELQADSEVIGRSDEEPHSSDDDEEDNAIGGYYRGRSSARLTGTRKSPGLINKFDSTSLSREEITSARRSTRSKKASNMFVDRRANDNNEGEVNNKYESSSSASDIEEQSTLKTSQAPKETLQKQPRAGSINTKINRNRKSSHHLIHRAGVNRDANRLQEKEYQNENDVDDAVESSEDEQDDSEEEPLKIQRVIASRTETKARWREICKNMCTSEIHCGSRWYQSDDESESDKSESNDRTPLNAKKSDKDQKFEERFLVKWVDFSFLHCSWETENDIVELVDGGRTALSNFFRKSYNGLLYTADERCDGDYFDPGYTQIERVLEILLPGGKDGSHLDPDDEDTYDSNSFGMIHNKNDPHYEDGVGRSFLIKWCNLSYSSSSYEYERDLIMNEVDYKSHVKAHLIRSKKMSKVAKWQLVKKGEIEQRRLYKDLFGEKANSDVVKREKSIESFKALLQERVYKNGGQLRDYQAEGVAWMVSNYVNERCSILCDEMGLGKTIQTAATVDFFKNTLYRPGPILIIAPLSTLAHWYREFHRWTDLNTILYHGNDEDRKLLRLHEFAYPVDRPESVTLNSSFLKKCCHKRLTKNENPWMVDVVITSPEMLLTDDYYELTHVQWEALVIDEAHRMKNHNSKLSLKLRSDKFEFKHKILLTGTPIQNDVKEFWTILNFIDSRRFNDHKAFLDKYGDMKSKELVDELHEEIRPFILRRLKEDVEKSVPPKEETLVEVELTIPQKQYYRALYEKNLKFLHKNKKRALDGPSLNNLAMQLRKVCNHLFLLNGVENEFRQKQSREVMSEGDLIVQGSGKLVLLDKLLPRLKEEGHRVLIFSQFKIMLDILQDYFVARGMKFERIDGSITGNRRQQAIDRFQSFDKDAKEQPFIMMLTTRAGGVGINLTAADTCIIFDSDWNPQNDLQAQARCHRIGQTKSVKVYRLISRKTYEMQMFHMSSLKMGLDQAVLNGVEGGSSSEATLSKEEVERLLRHGAYDIFNEDKTGTSEAESNNFVQLDIDSILQRRSRTVVHDGTGSKSGAAGGTFSKASFKVSKSSGEPSNSTVDDIDIEDPDFWTKMIGEPKDDEDTNILNKRRERKQINSYSEEEYRKNLTKMLGDSESDDSDHLSDDDDEVDLGSNEERSKWGGAGPLDWTKGDVLSLVQTISTFGYFCSTWESFAVLKSLEKSYQISEINRMGWSIIFVAIKEVIDDEVGLSKKKDSMDKNKTKVADSVSTEGGVLAVDQTAVAAQPVVEAVMKQKLFTKTLRCLGSWIHDVLRDAANYAKENKPRSKEVIDKLHNLTTTTTDDDPSSIFATNIWPSLKTRGWKSNIITEGNLVGRTLYSFKGINYTSPNAVLSAALTLHPELKNVIKSILQKSKEHEQQTSFADEQDRKNDLALNIESLDFDKMMNFFFRYAPVQLIVDRTKLRRIRLSKKILTCCSYLYNLNVLIKRVTGKSNDESMDKLLENIANAVVVDKRILLPHPQWSSHHDAVLIHAIQKHGWIENEPSCRAIVTDTDLKWGTPFDTSPTGSKNELVLQEKNPHVESAASRAAHFFNVHADLVAELKEFNQNLLIQVFGLTKELNGSKIWSANFNAMQPLPRPEEQVSNTTEVVELPSKKELVKRAKLLLSRLPPMNNFRSEVKSQLKYGLTVLDQTNPSNLLLGELLRALLKENCGSKINERICVIALNEAFIRSEELALLSKSDPNASGLARDMKNIYQQIDTVKSNLNKTARLYKNVVRAILGEEPMFSKNAGEELFPPKTKNFHTTENVKSSQSNLQKLSKYTAEAALESARMRLLYRYGTREGIATVMTGYDGLDLTEIETLILGAVCSYGIPTWSFESENALDLPPIVTSNASRAWSFIGHDVHKSAQSQFNEANDRYIKATKNFEKLRELKNVSIDKMSELKLLARSNYDNALLLRNSKHEVLKQSVDYLTNLSHLSQKCILMLVKIQKYMFETSVFDKPNLRLDWNVIKWLESEIFKWAKTLDLLSESGHPLAFTAVDFLDDLAERERISIEIHSTLNDKDSFSIIGQIAMITRVKSFMTRNSKSKLKEHLIVASQKIKEAGEMWDMQPLCWDISSDIVLLQRLSFHGLRNELMESKEFFGEEGLFVNQSYSDLLYGLQKDSIQIRANQLVGYLNELYKNDATRLETLTSSIEPSIVSSSTTLSSSLSNGDIESENPHMTIFQAQKPTAAVADAPDLSDDDDIEIIVSLTNQQQCLNSKRNSDVIGELALSQEKKPRVN